MSLSDVNTASTGHAQENVMPDRIQYFRVLATIDLQIKVDGRSKLIHRAALVSMMEAALDPDHYVGLSIIMWRRFLINYKGPSHETFRPVYCEGVQAERVREELLGYLSRKVAKLGTDKEIYPEVVKIEMTLASGFTPVVNVKKD